MSGKDSCLKMHLQLKKKKKPKGTNSQLFYFIMNIF